MKSGTRLGPYEIVSPIGAGGMGEVYRARDTRLDRNVAIKVLPAHLAGDADARARFEREARAVAALSHPNICALHDIGHDEGRDFLVMELLDGQTLQHRLDRGALELGQVLDFAIALADALDAAHARGIIHRDLKPANIFITSRGVPKILDFGLARSLGEVNYDITRKTDDALTAAGTIVGTVAYMSPEQLKGEPLDVRTDLFSLGLVLYEMATGQRAFSGPTAAVISAAILGQEPQAPRAVRADLPPRIEEAILKALDKDRELRCQTAAELRADFTRAKRQSGPDSTRSAASSPALPAAPAPLASSRFPTIGVIAAAFVAVAAIAAGLTFLLQRGAPAPAVVVSPAPAVARPAETPLAVAPAPAPRAKPVAPPRTMPDVAAPAASAPPVAQTSVPPPAPPLAVPAPVAEAAPTPPQPEGANAGAGRGRRGRAAGVPAAGALVARLRMLPPETFTLVFAANDPGSRTFAFQIRGALTSGGWTCESTTEIQEPQASFGVFAPAPSEGVKAVVAWARRAGFEPDVRMIARLQHPRIVIGRQQ